MSDIWSQTRRIQLTCPKGLSEILAKEVEGLGYEVSEVQTAGVELQGTLNDCMKLNLWLRTAHRVMFELTAGRCRDADELYELAGDVPWDQYIPSDGYFTITSSVRNDTINDTRFANLKLKDAVVDRIRESHDQRPDTGPSRDHAVIFLYWQGDEAGLFLDTTGEPLSHRGYRKVSTEAPMRETLAAACVLTTGWNGEGAFVNPMCGSGTLAIEAAWIAQNRPPANLRSNFAFMHLVGYENTRWNDLRKAANEQLRESKIGPILASDQDPSAVDAAKENAYQAGVEDLIEFSVCDFAQVIVPDPPGVLVYNPPYGERQGDVQDLVPLYKAIGDFMKQEATGYTGWVFTGNIRLLKQIGLHANEKRTLYNGRLECRLADFDLYA